MPELGAACGGGGRYDKMIGKFTGNDVPACGFSIGFERIILLLMESGFKIPERPKRVAYLVEKKYPAEKLVDVMKQAKEARENGQQVLVVRMNKNKKFQKEQLSKEGYEEFEEFFNKPLRPGRYVLELRHRLGRGLRSVRLSLCCRKMAGKVPQRIKTAEIGNILTG